MGAEETASQDEIERLYKHLAKQHHPDRGGDVEEMKAINEAFRVLGNAATRRAYDSLLQRRGEDFRAVEPPLSPPSSLVPDTISGRLLGALLFLLAGLVFLFLVRIYFIRFMWPILLAAVFVVIFGVWKVHAAMVKSNGLFNCASDRLLAVASCSNGSRSCRSTTGNIAWRGAWIN